MAIPKKDDVVWLNFFGILGIVEKYDTKRKTLLMQVCYNSDDGKYHYNHLMDSIYNIQILTKKEVFKIMVRLMERKLEDMANSIKDAVSEKRKEHSLNYKGSDSD